MSEKGKDKPGGAGEGLDWDDDWPTDVKLRALMKGHEAGVSVKAKEPDRSLPGDTARYPVAAKRPLPDGAALPRFLVVYLDVIGGPDVGTTHKVTMVNTVIGRGPEADIRIKDERASRKHAAIVYTGGEFRIRDEDSANGTFLNGSKVVEYAIRHGDKILVGDSLMQFHLGKSEE